jgi:zinc and cadmium transporter
MTTRLLLIALVLVANGFAGLAGGLLSERWLRRRQAALVAFAAGALLTASFVEVLPESVEALGTRALSWSFAGFVAFAILEWSLGHHHRRGHEEAPSTLPASLLFSDALHNVGDGAAIAAAFLVSPGLGVATALAVIAHEVPQEVGDYALLRALGFSRRRGLLALAAVQATAVLGAVGVVLAAQRFEEVVGAVLAIAAGTFLYIGATDLLPEVHSGRTPSDRLQRVLGFAAGVALIGAASAVELGFRMSNVAG